MEEELLLVDGADRVIGSASKKECHLLGERGELLLHRAFSVFLFDTEGRLLLQKRADEKITFPSCWTNTVRARAMAPPLTFERANTPLIGQCCSHPLGVAHEAETAGHTGVKRAAVRKLEHELGIEPAQVPLDSFSFVTRVRYESRSCEVWGESEIDHILVVRPPALTLRPCANEVSDLRWVTQAELATMVRQAAAGQLHFSPWFALIHREGLLERWWNTHGQLQPDDSILQL